MLGARFPRRMPFDQDRTVAGGLDLAPPESVERPVAFAEAGHVGSSRHTPFRVTARECELTVPACGR